MVSNSAQAGLCTSTVMSTASSIVLMRVGKVVQVSPPSHCPLSVHGGQSDVLVHGTTPVHLPTSRPPLSPVEIA
jgi:hypothetical protein